MSDLHEKGSRGNKSERATLYYRERRFLGELAEGKSPTDAALTAYNPKSRKVASQMGSAVMRRPRFLKVLEKAGITDEFLARKLMEGFEALKPVATKEGTELHADFQSRLGYLKTALKLKGHMAYEPEPEAVEPLIISYVRFKKNGITINNPIQDSPVLESVDQESPDSILPTVK